MDNNIINDSQSLNEEKKDIPNKYKKENGDEDEDEEEPEWAKDNVEDFYNIKIEFKSIPKSIEDKMEEKIQFQN